jgi:hypothetical protein
MLHEVHEVALNNPFATTCWVWDGVILKSTELSTIFLYQAKAQRKRTRIFAYSSVMVLATNGGCP